MQDIPKSLKAPNKREAGNRLHVIFMTDRGRTGRLTLSVTFFWVIGILVVLTFGTLFILAWKMSSLMVDHESARLKLKAMDSYYEARDYNRALREAPQEAGQILRRLDQAAANAETMDNDPVLPWGVEAEPPAQANAAPAGNPPNPANPGAPANPGEQGANAPEQASGNPQGEGPEQPEQGDPSQPEEPAAQAEPSKDAGQDNPGAAAPASPEAEAWAAFQKRLPAITGPELLDVDDFRMNPGGSYSYYLKRVSTNDGENRLRGRAIIVFAVADKAGKVTLVPDPQIDLGVPSQGYDNGGKYNIVSSKVYRGNVKVPTGGKLLSAQVLAWDETTKDLIFQKKIVIGDPRGD